ncbi:hypothetical protein As57867_005986, partial [Aphanomyces stellatus]
MPPEIQDPQLCNRRCLAPHKRDLFVISICKLRPCRTPMERLLVLLGRACLLLSLVPTSSSSPAPPRWIMDTSTATGRAVLADGSITDSNVMGCPAWQSQSYTTTASSGLCLGGSFFNASNVAHPVDIPPIPSSAYIFTLDHPLFPNGGFPAGASALSDPTNSSLFPRVTMTTLLDTLLAPLATSPTITTTTLHAEVDYNWQDYGDNRAAYVWRQFGAGMAVPGIYRVDMNAWDWFNPSGICELCVAMTDAVRPKSASACPVAPPVSQIGWSTRLNSLTTYLRNVGLFATSYTNNDCNSPPPSNASACANTTQISAIDWFRCPVDLSSYVAAPTNALRKPFDGTCVPAALTQGFSSTSVLASPGALFNTTACTRIISFEYTWRELWVNYSCTGPSVGYCNSGADGAVGGDLTGTNASRFQCANTFSLAATPADLVGVVTLATNPAIQANPQYIANPDVVFPGQGYNPTTDNATHFWSPLATANADLDELVPITVAVATFLSPS